MAVQVFKCKSCPTLILMLEKSACTPHCCGEPMVELTANTTDAAAEKHVPAVTVDGDVVKVVVGSTIHPMEEKHYITLIALETEDGVAVKYLKPGQAPEAVFNTAGSKPVAVYEYCSLHGLWKADIA